MNLFFFIFYYFLVYHTFEYDKKFKYNNYTIEFQINEIKNYGNIINFILINDQIFCFVQLFILNRKKNFYNISKDVSQILLKHFNKFFFKAKLSNTYDLIKIENICNKCILTKINKNDYFIMPVVDLNEHD